LKGNLFLASTPIGNLQDLTKRIKDIFLSGIDIYCENPLRTLKLTNYIGSSNKVFKYIDNPETKSEIIDKLCNGQDIVYTSGAGMPVLSDPGGELVSECLDKQINVVPVCGATSLVFLSVCGLSVSSFAFLGFLRKGKFFDLGIFDFVNTIIFFENPRRIKKTLNKMYKVTEETGETNCMEVSIGIELTKKFESIVKFSLADMEAQNLQFRGELIVGISRKK
jgi:16S rRNA (cytidine1402-2'-O)-methyltransferase